YEAEGAVRLGLPCRQIVLLQGENGVEACEGSAEHARDRRKLETHVLQSEDLVEPRERFGAVEAPAGFIAQRFHKTLLFIEPQSYRGNAESFGRYGVREIYPFVCAHRLSSSSWTRKLSMLPQGQAQALF